MANIPKIYNLYKEYGIDGILERFKKRFYIKLNLYKVNLVNIIGYSEKVDMELVPMDIEILNVIYKVYKSEISERKYEILRKRLDKLSTDKGYVVMDNDGDVYGYYYIAFKKNLETTTNYLVPYEPSNIYLFDDYTFTNKRGKGAHKFSIYRRLKIGTELGYKTATVAIKVGNIPSEKAYLSFGFKRYREIIHYNLRLLKKNVIREL